jgi:alkylation response protein AidB-like acyl-CoA dehydrogenase
MSMRETDGGVLLSGSKKPCSLATSMDLLTASYVRATAAGDELMVALVPARSPGLTRHAFWNNRALAGAQSDEVRLQDVNVPNRMLFSAGLKQALGEVQIVGFVWFELLMSASYLGACSGFVEQVIQRERWTAADRMELACGLQLCMSALEGISAEFAQDGCSLDDLLPRLLLLRYELERHICRISDLAHEMLGGVSFIQSEESSLWLLSCRGLRFHPPARISMVANLATYLRGGAFFMAPAAQS